MRTRIFCAIVALVCLAGWESFGQTKTDVSIPDLLQGRTELKAPLSTQPEMRSVALDSPLDPSAYYVGPGDVLALRVWIATPVESQLTVTPEGVLLIPTVGSVSVSGLTLDEARRRVVEYTQKKYPRADVSLNLVTPRRVSVQILGQVLNEGKQEISAALRVSHLIEVADALPSTQTTKEFYFTDLPTIRRQASQRLIALRRNDGSSQRVDLVKYDATRKSIYNPYLREGDMVYVPRRLAQDNSLGVFGAVANPTNIEFVDGDSLSDLVAIGYGMKPEADPGRAWLARQSDDGTTMDSVHVDLQGILAGRVPNIALRPGDRLVIPVRPESRRGDFVGIEGEVARPGRYPITPFTTKLSDVVRMAGGFTDNANISGSTLVRGQIELVNTPEELTLEKLKSTRTAFTVPGDSVYYASEMAVRMKAEAVSVNFRKLFIDHDTTYDVTLRNFDRLTIPPRTKSVYVFGQVLQPGDVPYVPGNSYKYYIEKARGYAGDARSSDVKVIKAGSRIWLDPDETEIEDGDAIWVPKEYYYPFGYYLSTVAQIASILATAATLIILARTL